MLDQIRELISVEKHNKNQCSKIFVTTEPAGALCEPEVRGSQYGYDFVQYCYWVALCYSLWEHVYLLDNTVRCCTA